MFCLSGIVRLSGTFKNMKWKTIYIQNTEKFYSMTPAWTNIGWSVLQCKPIKPRNGQMEILIHTVLLMFLPLPIRFTRESKGSLILAEGLRDSESVLEADHNLLLRKKKLQLTSLAWKMSWRSDRSQPNRTVYNGFRSSKNCVPNYECKFLNRD